ncbi:N-acetyltransferase [Cyanobium sp. HWJ4-Hawea]|uniref:GNAT family N-acetyltransferase n=1 Tax=Cyanobium sp. HWJ4-Hawea TaxID=2823713 RepID=UPI0020CB95BB|nr:GNAT family N-acetyltransferase [Cyanobium sp. HWJ4-Hawea]MCP9809917.1 N-acetyltransferase [Cyanobium sp. HWJ4-Hawea]
MVEFPEATWDCLAAGIPFFSWRWLHQLEASGSIVPRQGWQSCHLGLWRGEQLIAAAPLYLKGHSYGEFVFDQSFAQLAGQLGLRYYPKLVGMSPLSPVQGYRFLIDPSEDPAEITALMLQQVEAFCRQQRLLSCNFLYVDPAWQPLVEASGWAPWVNQQSQWVNPGFEDFNGYLASFNANQRRNIKRERQAVAAAGLQVSPVVGEEITPALMERMHYFYGQHCSRWGAWGSKYLTEEFFTSSTADLRANLVLFSAHLGDPQEPVAMSLCVHTPDQLWGRYWGSEMEIDCLHFEVCYYAPIAWAISRGIRQFDPGAGGSHKRRRGFVAEPRTSLHAWFEPQFDAILRRWLPGANIEMGLEIEAVNGELPFTASYDPPHA